MIRDTRRPTLVRAMRCRPDEVRELHKALLANYRRLARLDPPPPAWAMRQARARYRRVAAIYTAQ